MVLVAAAAPVSAAMIEVSTTAPYELTLEPAGTAFHTTYAVVTNERVIEVPGTTILLLLWEEQVPPDDPVPYYALSFDGVAVSRVYPTSYVLKLTAGAFDPLGGVPAVHASLQANGSNELYVVQFFTQPLKEFSDAIEGLGGTVRGYLPHTARIVQMNDTTKTVVEGLNYVRSVSPFHPAYRLEDYLRDNIDQAEQLFPLEPYDILVFEPGLAQKTVVGDHIETIGGPPPEFGPCSSLLQATLTPTQLLSVVQLNEVAFVARWFAPQPAMDKARKVGHANFVEDEDHGGFTGQGVIGEVADRYLDTGCNIHLAFAGTCSACGSPCGCDLHCGTGCGVCVGAPILHKGTAFPGDPPQDHGTNVFGILFGDGTGTDPNLHPNAKGMLPDAQGIFADICTISDLGCSVQVPGDITSRCCHTCELVNPSSICEFTADEICPEGYGPQEYNAVFQSFSQGTVPQAQISRPYHPKTHLVDDVLFTFEIILCQSQGNEGIFTPSWASMFEAWAKNAVSVGGVYHHDTASMEDDQWGDPTEGTRASTGPALDGRIKPDFTHFYDDVYTTKQGGGYEDFGGTSAATPITCGHFGLFFQMWAEGVFPHELAEPECEPATDPCVFINRPHMSTAKAMMINTARQYPFEQEPPPAPLHDKARVRQGWGVADVGKLYLLRNQFLHIDNEDTILELGGSKSYDVNVQANTHALKVTLAYTDPAGDSYSAVHTKNDLNLRVKPPSWLPGLPVYWGNCGLREGNWSTTCEKENPTDPRMPSIDEVRDTVENVFVENPVAGTWKVEVSADVIVEDARVETPTVDDADFALVVSVDLDCNQNDISDADDILDGNSFDTNNNAVPDECDPEPALTAPYPNDRRKNRYISFDPNKSENDGKNIAFKVELEQITLGSCSDGAGGGTGGFCRRRCSESILQPCSVNTDCPAGETCTTHDCNTCSVDGNACLTQGIDCAPDASQTCDVMTGQTCENDFTLDDDPILGQRSAGRIWWVGPESPLGNGVHLMVSEAFRKVSTSWPNPTHVGDCEIVPQAKYNVYAVDVDTRGWSAALSVETTQLSASNVSSWGDGVGQLKKFCGGDIRTPECVDDNDCTAPQTCDLAWTLPDGITGNDDINALLALIESPSSMPPPDVAWMDLHGNESGLPGAHNIDPPNFRADFADVTNLVLAQFTRPYPFNDPADCPDLGTWPTYQASTPPPGSPVFTLVPNDNLLDPGQDLQVEVYVSEATNVFAHEVALEVTGGTSGTLTVTDITVDQNRTDYVFYGIAAPLQAKDLPGMRIGSCLNTAGPGVTGTGQVYLATFTFQPSGGANGVFSINVLGDGRSFLLNPDGSAQTTDTSGTAVIGYGVDCLDVADCDDNNECTTDSCTASNECQYTNVASGTACRDGLWCTLDGSTCDGNGNCTGGAPRCPPGYLCDESAHQCFGAPPP